MGDPSFTAGIPPKDGQYYVGAYFDSAGDADLVYIAWDTDNWYEADNFSLIGPPDAWRARYLDVYVKADS